METKETYDTKVVRYFIWAGILWGVVGMSVGALIALQLYWPGANFEIPYLTFGRLRPLHTNAVIFGFTACMLFGGGFYIVQRTGEFFGTVARRKTKEIYVSNWSYRNARSLRSES